MRRLLVKINIWISNMFFYLKHFYYFYHKKLHSKFFASHTKVILMKMCSSVDVKYVDVNFKKEQWFLEHTWTCEKETKFKNWLVSYLYRKESARDELMSLTYKSKKNCMKAAEDFIFNYGWKCVN